MNSTTNVRSVQEVASTLVALLPTLARGSRPVTYTYVGSLVHLDRSSPLLAAALTLAGRTTQAAGKGNVSALVTRSGPRPQRLPGPGYFTAFHPEAPESDHRALWLADHAEAMRLGVP